MCAHAGLIDPLRRPRDLAAHAQGAAFLATQRGQLERLLLARPHRDQLAAPYKDRRIRKPGVALVARLPLAVQRPSSAGSSSTVANAGSCGSATPRRPCRSMSKLELHVPSVVIPPDPRAARAVAHQDIAGKGREIHRLGRRRRHLRHGGGRGLRFRRRRLAGRGGRSLGRRPSARPGPGGQSAGSAGSCRFSVRDGCHADSAASGRTLPHFATPAEARPAARDGRAKPRPARLSQCTRRSRGAARTPDSHPSCLRRQASSGLKPPAATIGHADHPSTHECKTLGPCSRGTTGNMATCPRSRTPLGSARPCPQTLALCGSPRHAVRARGARSTGNACEGGHFTQRQLKLREHPSAALAASLAGPRRDPRRRQSSPSPTHQPTRRKPYQLRGILWYKLVCIFLHLFVSSLRSRDGSGD